MLQVSMDLGVWSQVRRPMLAPPLWLGLPNPEWLVLAPGVVALAHELVQALVGMAGVELR